MKPPLSSGASLMVFLLMVATASVSGCTYDDDSYLQDEVTTTTRRPTEAENRMYHAIRLEVIKLRLLRGLGILKPPEIPRGATITLKDDVRSLPLPNYLRMKHSGLRTATEAPFMKPFRKGSSRVIVFAELGSNSPCQLSKSVLRNYTPVSFKLPSDPSLIQRAVLQFKIGFQPKMREWICTCSTSDYTSDDSASASSNNVVPTAQFHPRDAKCQQLSSIAEASAGPARSSTPEVIMKATKKGRSYVHLGRNWKSFVSGSSGTEKRLLFLMDGQLSNTERARPSLILEVDKEMSPTKNYPLRMKRAGSRESALDECATTRNSSSCCRIGVWVDFEELGWSDWILSPAGFYFYFCTGQCRRGFEGTAVRGGAIDKGATPSRRLTCCLPATTSPLKIVMIAGWSSLNQTVIPNFIIDECACISQNNK